MLTFCPIQSTLNSPSRELMLTGIVGIVNRYFITVVKTSLGSVAFLLFQVFNSVSKTKCFKLSSKLPERYLNKILVVRFTNINFLLDTWVVANYQFTYFMSKAMVNYYPCSFVQVVSNAVVTPLIKFCLFLGKRFNSLLIFLRLKLCITFVVPLINAFKFFPINQKLMPLSVNTSAQVINAQVNSNSLIRIQKCFYFLSS